MFGSKRKRAIRREAVRLEMEARFMDQYIAMTADMEKPKAQHCVVKGFGEWDIPKGMKLLPLLREVRA